MAEVPDGFLEGVEQLRLFENVAGPGSCLKRAFFHAGLLRPAISGGNKAHLAQTEIRHGPRAHADILGELRLDQDDDRGGGLDGRAGAVSAGTGHGNSLRMIWCSLRTGRRGRHTASRFSWRARG